MSPPSGTSTNAYNSNRRTWKMGQRSQKELNRLQFAVKHMRIKSNQKCVRAQAPYIPVAPSSVAKPVPPKHTSTRHDMDGMNFFSCALHLDLASSSFGRAHH